MGDRRDDGRFDDTVLRATGALCLFGVALIHFLDFFAKLSETPYLAALYGVLMAVTVGAGLVWSVNRSTGVLDGLDPTTGHPTATHPVSLDSSQHFPVVTVAPGHVLVESVRRVVAFSLPASATTT